jgi:hypothetical protein
MLTLTHFTCSPRDAKGEHYATPRGRAELLRPVAVA